MARRSRTKSHQPARQAAVLASPLVFGLFGRKCDRFVEKNRKKKEGKTKKNSTKDKD
jgi:hypothetical protein